MGDTPKGSTPSRIAMKNATRSRSSTEADLKKRVLITLPMAVVAPIPRARQRSVVSEKTGRLASFRSASVISFIYDGPVDARGYHRGWKFVRRCARDLNSRPLENRGALGRELAPSARAHSAPPRAYPEFRRLRPRALGSRGDVEGGEGRGRRHDLCRRSRERGGGCLLTIDIPSLQKTASE